MKFTVDLAKNGETGNVFAARLSAIASVETPDERTSVIKLSRADAGLLDTLTKLMILPEHALAGIPPKELAKNAWWSTTPIGTGPFKFNQYVTDQYVELVADDDYRGGTPKVDRLINRYFKNPAAAVAALRAGEIQFTYVEPDDVATFKDNNGFQVIEGQSTSSTTSASTSRSRSGRTCACARRSCTPSTARPSSRASTAALRAGQLRLCRQAARARRASTPTSTTRQRPRRCSTEAGWDKINGNKPITWLTYYNTPAGRQRHGRRPGDARAGRHQRRAAGGRHADLQRHHLRRQP